MAPKVVTTASRAPARAGGVTLNPKGGAAASKKDATDLKRVGTASKTGKRAKAEKNDVKQKKQLKQHVKKWLKTPADWARFEAWAKINAQPKKYPEPEPIIRPSKPLNLLKKRIELLIELPERTDPRVHCKPVETPVTQAALNAVLTKRLLKLALPRLRLADYGRALPVTICKATLCYEPSNRILCLSQPRLHIPEECKPVAIPSGSKNKLCANRRLCELMKKLAACPEGLTDEERLELFTAAGIRRSALEYKITPWMDFLALPWYKNIRPRRDKDAKEWKKTIITELEIRGKKVLEEQKKQKEKKKRKKQEEEKGEAKGEGDVAKPAAEEGEEEKTEDQTEGQTEGGQTEGQTEEDVKKKEEASKKRHRAKHAWRYAPLPYKSYSEAFLVKKSALQKEASPRTIALAEAKARKDLTTKKKPFSVKKGALSAVSSDRINQLAAPKKPLSPVEKAPPREKDKYGRPIIPMPKYGKVLPKTKPYKMGECPKKEENKEEKKEKKPRPIDPIVYEPTIDPAIFPELARKQQRERQRAEKILMERRQQQRAKKNLKAGDAQVAQKGPKEVEAQPEAEEPADAEEY